MRRKPARFARPALAGLLVLAAGCSGPDPVARRFEAERAQWHLRRTERSLGTLALSSRPVREHLRAAHQDLARRFGPDHTVSPASRLSADERDRYAIAGKSALYAAELAERDGTDDSLRREFADIAQRYAFDPEIPVRARVHEGLAWEEAGDVTAALSAYRAALEAPDLPAGGSPASERLRADLELHAVIVARGAAGAGTEVAAARARLAQLAAEAGGAEAAWIRRRLAEVCAAGGDGDEAARILGGAISDSTRTDADAELRVRLGEVHEILRGSATEAESLYRKAGAQAAGRPVGTDARVHLANLLRSTDRPREATDVYALVIAASVAEDDPARVEALYGRGIAWEALNRWEDAIPALARGAAEHGPFALASQARLARQFRIIDHPEAEQVTHDLVARATAAADAAEPAPALRDWAWLVRHDREAAAWGEVLEELGTLAAERPGTSLADSARTARARLGSRAFVQRVFAGR